MKKIALLFFLFAFVHGGLAQSSVYILQVKGDVYAVNRGIVSSFAGETRLKRGGEIKRGTTVNLHPSSALTCIDTEGNTYFIMRRGPVTYEQLISSKRSTTGITAKYMQRLMAELNSNYRYTSKSIGGVVRIDENIMISKTSNIWDKAYPDSVPYMMTYPMDSSYVRYTTIVLKWEPKDLSTNEYFVFIKQKDDSDFIKIPVADATSLNVARARIRIQPDQEWVWAVSDRESPDLEQLQTFSFKTLSTTEYNAKIKDYNSMYSDMRRLGFAKEEIDEIVGKVIYLECNISI